MKAIHKVSLVFFVDEANGEYGVSHKETFNDNSPFNAFWDGIGIFHDVFEHWHEKTHKYFMGNNAMNIGGEMAAMGAMYYYINEMGVCARNFRGRDTSRMVIETTINNLIECLKYGRSDSFSDTLECNVPYQKPTNTYLDDIVNEYWHKVKQINPNKSNFDYIEDFESAIQLRKTISKSKIERLHRWGFKMAERLVPDSYHNQNVLHNFITFFNEFCENNRAEDLSHVYSGLDINIYRKNGKIEFTAKLIGFNGVPNKFIYKKDLECLHIEDSLIDTY